MASALGISRTPMRKAIARLEGEGLLIRLTDRLVSVKIVSLSECIDAFNVRKLIEPEATRLATPRITQPVLDQLTGQLTELINDNNPDYKKHWSFDDNLHGTIAKFSGNSAMIQTITLLRRTTRLFEQMEVPIPTLSPGTKEHLNIIKKLESRSAGKAAHAMRAHLEKSCINILDQF